MGGRRWEGERVGRMRKSECGSRKKTEGGRMRRSEGEKTESGRRGIAHRVKGIMVGNTWLR